MVWPTCQLTRFDPFSLYLSLFQVGDLGLAVSSSTSLRKAGVAGTPSHIPPEASKSTKMEPDEAWDVFT